MKYAKSCAFWIVGTTLVLGQAAQAADSVYVGDCNRARVVQQQSTIDTLLPHSRYEGISRNFINADWAVACQTDQLSNYTLKQRSRSTSAVIFDIIRIDINHHRKAGCSGPMALPPTITGTVTFSTYFAQKGELCEVYIWSDWKQTMAGNASWAGNWANRVVSMDGGAFTIAQPASTGGKYTTPIGFTGVYP